MSLLAAERSATAGDGALADRIAAEHAARWPRRSSLDAVCEYAVFPAGKLLRPGLLLDSCIAVGGDPDAALRAALAVEYLHAASLVHDDIVDGARQRRGRPSVAERFGTPVALLVGDALVFQAFRACLECAGRGAPVERSLAAAEILAATGSALCAGQHGEAELCNADEPSLEAYRAVAAGKTGSLFAASCRVGALLGGGDAEQVAALGEFGERLGVAFQMSDDLAPYLGVAQTKDPLADVVGRRMTFPLVVARHELGEVARGVIEEAFELSTPPLEAHRLLVRLVLDERVRAAVAAHVRGGIDATREPLRQVPHGAARDRLDGVARAVGAVADDLAAPVGERADLAVLDLTAPDRAAPDVAAPSAPGPAVAAPGLSGQGVAGGWTGPAPMTAPSERVHGCTSGSVHVVS